MYKRQENNGIKEPILHFAAEEVLENYFRDKYKNYKTADLQVTPDFIFSNMLQYDNITESLGVNSRLQLEYKPGAKMFLVVNQGYLDERTGLVMKEFEVVTKVGALFRF